MDSLRSPILGRALARTTPTGDEKQIPAAGRKWYAVYTAPQNGRSVVKHLNVHQIESFLPPRESAHGWKNRQRVKIVQPLFPSCVFVRIHAAGRSMILRSPGVVRIAGNSHGPIPNRTLFVLRHVSPPGAPHAEQSVACATCDFEP